jgi:hypothetical protein
MYLYPLRGQGLVGEEELGHMFGNIEQLWSISSELLWALEERLQQWSPDQLLGDVFLNLVCNSLSLHVVPNVSTVDHES